VTENCLLNVQNIAPPRCKIQLCALPQAYFIPNVRDNPLKIAQPTLVGKRLYSLVL
jgi:hypothetical protein